MEPIALQALQAECVSLTVRREAEPREQRVPRQSPGTRNTAGGVRRDESFLTKFEVCTRILIVLCRASSHMESIAMKSSKSIVQAILDMWPIQLWQASTIVVAVSGGADSTALLEALFQIKPDSERLIVAHFNHALRGDESDADQAFVESHAARLGLKCFVQRATKTDVSNATENNLRKLRHQFLKDVAVSQHARWIAMAHQADDQVETFLHHLLRGSGPSGLSGIQAFRELDSSIEIARPMLRVRRAEILDYLTERHQSFRVDRSNASLDYTRNRIRNELLPTLRTFMKSESLDQRLLQARDLIAEEHAVFVELADRWLAKIGYASEESLDTWRPNHFSVPVPMCRNEPWPIIRESLVMIWHRMGWPLREMDHQHWRKMQMLIELASQTTHPKRLQLPGQVVATCRNGMLRIAR